MTVIVPTVDELNVGIGNIQSQLDKLVTTVTQLSTSVDNVVTALANINTRLTNIEGRLTKLETTPTPAPTPTPTPIVVDKFGIKKVYPDADVINEWYVSMDNPASTPNFNNLPTITKQNDGSFQTSDLEVRMEAWSPINKKWLNVEITAYQKLIAGIEPYVFQLYRGGGHHSSTTPERQCWGAAYKTAMLSNGTAGASTSCRKEINHPAYCPNRSVTKTSTKPLVSRWIGMKQVTYQYLKNGKTFVRMEVYVDDDVNDSQGNLMIKNDWKLYANTRDEGGWGTTETDFVTNCPPLNKDSTQQYRQRDEILNLPGGNTAEQNLCAWRTDATTNNWKYLSVREIKPPTT